MILHCINNRINEYRVNYAYIITTHNIQHTFNSFIEICPKILIIILFHISFRLLSCYQNNNISQIKPR